ncbi:hypothetical protein GQ457_10G012190 [Hibiscus cannabinus]
MNFQTTQVADHAKCSKLGGCSPCPPNRSCLLHDHHRESLDMAPPAEMKTLCDKIVGIMLDSLGLTHEDDMKWFQPKNESDQTQCVFQLNSYPVCPYTDRAMGLALHTDTSLITLLNLCNINGLQVYQDGAGWDAVELIEGTLVVNVGDLMQIVYNGRFKSALHRTVVNNTCHHVTPSTRSGVKSVTSNT